MKPFPILFVLVLLLHRECISQQQTYIRHPQTREEFIQKSRNQRTGGWLLLGSGIVGIAAIAPGNASFGTAGTVVLLSGAALLGSVPLFLAAHRNKKKAMRMEAYMEIDRRIEYARATFSSRHTNSHEYDHLFNR